MNQKRIVNIILIVIVSIAAVSGYFILSKKSTTPTAPSASHPESAKANIINGTTESKSEPKSNPGGMKLISPNGREKWTFGRTQKVHWTGPTSVKYVGIELLGKIKNCTTAPCEKLGLQKGDVRCYTK